MNTSKYNLPMHINQSPRDMRVQYSAVSEEATVQETSSSAKVIYVYCSPWLKHAISFVWKLILVVYVIAIPMFVYLLHKDNQENLVKLRAFENKYEAHVKLNTRQETTENRVRKSLQGSMKTALEQFEKAYKRPIDESLKEKVKVFNNTVFGYETRMRKLKVYEDWLSNLYERYKTNRSECNCRTESCQCNEKVGGATGETTVVSGPRGRKGDRGAPGNRGKDGLPGEPGVNASCGSSNGKDASTVYTRWGSKQCGSQSKQIYSGYMGGSQSNAAGGGSNYLCLPIIPKYAKYSGNHNDFRGTIDGIIYGGSFQLSRRSVLCSVCQTVKRSVTITMPATTQCPNGWFLEFTGNIASQAEHARTEYICVDQSSNSIEVSLENYPGAIDTVEANCDVLPCGPYNDKKLLPCAVCSQ